MTDLTRPGPPTIPPGAAPGGIVIHVYAVPTSRLLHTSSATTIADAAYRAGLDANAAIAALDTDAGEDALCLVAYDGDTGNRYGLEDWLAP